MRSLFLSNLYPPVSIGGFELWCQEIAEGFSNRGHEILILTNRVGREGLRGKDPAWVCRDLYPEMEDVPLLNSLQFFLSRKVHEEKNLECFHSDIQRFHPDLVFLWGMWNIHRSLPALAETLMGDRVVNLIDDTSEK